MRREGRAHGMVQTIARGVVQTHDSRPTAGLFTKISNKPSNHSKFTGKLFTCHDHPVSKSRPKSKGIRQFKSSDSVVNYELNTLRIMGLNNLRNSGYSASGILHELDTNHHYFYNNYDDYYDYDDDAYDNHDHDDDHHDDDYHDDDDEYENENDEQAKTELILIETMRDNDDDDVIIHVGVTDDGDDGYMGFYDVAYVLSSVEVEDEGWFLVGGDQM